MAGIHRKPGVTRFPVGRKRATMGSRTRSRNQLRTQGQASRRGKGTTALFRSAGKKDLPSIGFLKGRSIGSRAKFSAIENEDEFEDDF
jgi:hypothetical protein